MRHLEIRKFGPVEHASLDLKRVSIIIGPQSSGKSTILKVACFCAWLERQLMMAESTDKLLSQQVIEERLLKFHKMTKYIRPETVISYRNDALGFSYTASTQRWTFEWNKDRWSYRRPKIAYIPAERNLVAAIPNWYQVTMNADNILDFMKEWESARKSFVDEEQILNLPARYVYNQTTQKDGIRLIDDKEIDLTEASSGLQAMTPLYIMLRYLTDKYFINRQSNVEQQMIRERLVNTVGQGKRNLSRQEIERLVDGLVTPEHADLYIEEPEAHIFPSTQKDFVYSLVNMLGSRERHSCCITTHSPYILTSLNNLILAGEKMSESCEMTGRVRAILPGCSTTLRCQEVAAYSMKDGIATDIMDDEFHLISAEAIDGASEEIGADFEKLLDL